MSMIMAHRGARNLWAENSIYGFKETIKHGFDGIEFDLHLTDAGEVVVIHDATLERTTNATGLVRLLTPQSRKELQLKGPDGTLIEEGVASFEEALEVLAQSGETKLYVELKSDENGVPYPGLVEKAVDILRSYGLQRRSALHSFDINVLHEIADKAPEFERLISVNQEWADKQGGIGKFIDDVKDLVDVVGIHHALYEAEFDLITKLLPRERTSVWTINDEDLMRRWIARKPGWLVSDNPVLLREMMQEAGAV